MDLVTCRCMARAYQCSATFLHLLAVPAKANAT